jgi:hypothetical protein
MSCYWRHAPFQMVVVFVMAALLAKNIHFQQWWLVALDVFLLLGNMGLALLRVEIAHDEQREAIAEMKALEDRRKAVFWHSYEKEKEEE